MTRRIVTIMLVGASAFALAACSAENEPAGQLGSSAPSQAPATSSTADPSVAGEASPSADVAASETAASERASSYGVGDRVRLGDEEFFGVTDVDPNVKGDGFLKPDDGMKWVSALVEIEGINPDGATYNPFYFTVRDGEGFEYDVSIFGKEPSLQSSNELQPGQKVKGWVTFEVPTDAKGLTLIYSAGPFGEPVEIALG
jgi:hypothetical protein